MKSSAQGWRSEPSWPSRALWIACELNRCRSYFSMTTTSTTTRTARGVGSLLTLNACRPFRCLARKVSGNFRLMLRLGVPHGRRSGKDDDDSYRMD